MQAPASAKADREVSSDAQKFLAQSRRERMVRGSGVVRCATRRRVLRNTAQYTLRPGVICSSTRRNMLVFGDDRVLCLGATTNSSWSSVVTFVTTRR